MRRTHADSTSPRELSVSSTTHDAHSLRLDLCLFAPPSHQHTHSSDWPSGSFYYLQFFSPYFLLLLVLFFGLGVDYSAANVAVALAVALAVAH